MLTLTRRAGQSLLLGSGIEIRVVRIQGDRVLLGVDAPRSLTVVRAEIAAAVREETTASAGAGAVLIELLAGRAGLAVPASMPASAPAKLVPPGPPLPIRDLPYPTLGMARANRDCR